MLNKSLIFEKNIYPLKNGWIIIYTSILMNGLNYLKKHLNLLGQKSPKNF